MSVPILEELYISDKIKKVCKVCEKEKEITTHFSFHKTYNCYSNCCKDCANLRRRLLAKRLPIPDEYKNLIKPKRVPRIVENKPYRKTTYPNRRRLDYKATDKKKGLDHDLSLDYITKALDSPCIYCGYPTTGLDRIDNSKGHTEKNCVPCCFECNTARNTHFTYEEMFIIGKAIKQVKDLKNNGTIL